MEPVKRHRLFQIPKLAGRDGRNVLDLFTAKAKAVRNEVYDTPDGNHEDESHHCPNSQLLALLLLFCTLMDEEAKHSPDEHQERNTEHQRNKGVVDESGDPFNKSVDLAELCQSHHRGKGDGH